MDGAARRADPWGGQRVPGVFRTADPVEPGSALHRGGTVLDGGPGVGDPGWGTAPANDGGRHGDRDGRGGDPGGSEYLPRGRAGIRHREQRLEGISHSPVRIAVL